MLKNILYILLLLPLIGVGQTSATITWDDITTVYYEDFESINSGTVTTGELDTLFPNSLRVNGLSRIYIENENDTNKSFRVKLLDNPLYENDPAYSGCLIDMPLFQYPNWTELGAGSELYLSFDLRVSSGWSWGTACQETKLPRMMSSINDGGDPGDWDITNPSGGLGKPDNVGVEWFEAGDISRNSDPLFAFYCYYPDMTYYSSHLGIFQWGAPDVGWLPTTTAYFYNNNGNVPFDLSEWGSTAQDWNNLTFRIVLNGYSGGNGEYTGIMTGWFNGELISQIDSVQFRGTEEDLYLNWLRIGSHMKCSPSSDQYIYYDNIAVYTINPGITNVSYGHNVTDSTVDINYPRLFGEAPSSCTPVQNTFGGADSVLATRIKINFTSSTPTIPSDGYYTNWNTLYASNGHANSDLVDDTGVDSGFDLIWPPTLNSHYNGATPTIYPDSTHGQWRADAVVKRAGLSGFTIGKKYILTIWGSYLADHGVSDYEFNSDAQQLTTYNNTEDTLSWHFTADSVLKYLHFGTTGLDYLGVANIYEYTYSAGSDSVNSDTLDLDLYKEYCGVSVDDSIYNFTSDEYVSYYLTPNDSVNKCIITSSKDNLTKITITKDSVNGLEFGSASFMSSTTIDTLSLSTINSLSDLCFQVDNLISITDIRFIYLSDVEDTLAISDTLYAVYVDEFSNCQLQDVAGVTTVGYMDSLDFYRYYNVDFESGYDSLNLFYVASPDYLGDFEMWVGDTGTGTLISEWTTISTGGWYTFDTLSIDLNSTISGIKDTITVMSLTYAGGNHAWFAPDNFGQVCTGTATIATSDFNDFTCSMTTVNGILSYQWKLNDANVGDNLATYNNTSLVTGDKVQCIVTSTICGNFNSNNIVYANIPAQYFYIIKTGGVPYVWNW